MTMQPIYDFARAYARSNPCRFHMPGHKGHGPLGCEELDITEIDGADSLFEASGIIARSEENASRLLGCPTFYSTEGSTLALRAMLFLAVTHSSGNKKILAARNSHRAFIYSAALIDFDICWLYPERFDSYHSCIVSPAQAERAILAERPCALYITSPDYLGNIADIGGIAEVCHRHNVLLLVDAAHGSYLRFIRPSLHPMDLGADMCSTSAHKTLPVLTGGAYLHVREAFAPRAKQALELFASTSPSYLILESLDACNACLEALPRKLSTFLSSAQELRAFLIRCGYTLKGDELSRLTIDARAHGYSGAELARNLMKKNILAEFCDRDYLVLMAGPENSADELEKLKNALAVIPARTPITASAPAPSARRCVMRPREALFSPAQTLPVKAAAGRVLASACASCPPAVPILMCGEEIDESAAAAMEYYGLNTCTVVR